MKVLVAMSGGVDSSVAAALVLAAGHETVGATMKLWGGPSDSGCCSVSDVEDARRVASQLGIDHHVFNFSAEFGARVVDRYVSDHAAGRTPNPCVECNRHMKFDRFLARAGQLGFDAVATGHHARVEPASGGGYALRRGADAEKDQSYVLYMLGQDQLARVILPVGAMTKAAVRERAVALGLRTATKPDSQDVCFISRGGGGRVAFLGGRIPLRPGVVVDESGRELGRVPAVEAVTVGQRKGLGPAVGERYVVDVDARAGVVRVGPLDQLLVGRIPVTALSWTSSPPAASEALSVQMSAHGRPVGARWQPEGSGGDGCVVLDQAVRRVAPGQSVVLYRGDAVVGGGVAAAGLTGDGPAGEAR